MPIDYSKWDNLDVSSSSEDEDDAKPRVTRLDAPTKVTFGGGSVSATKAATPSQAPSTKPPTPKSTTPTSVWTDHGGLLKTKGGERNLYWSQDRHSVTLRLELSTGEKIKSVAVDGILPYADRWSAVGSIKPKLVVFRSVDVVLLEGELPHPIHLEEDSDDGIVDWSIEDTNGHRVLCIILHKAVPMQGLSVWWRRPMMEFPEAELGEVRGEGGTSKEFLAAWEEAHKIFREGKQKP
mmetsp:Transcript_15912/g.39935  ORF Transcript_15912/g.39935 Transcript_15912/m.39935 type:complete len:237 (+) Transcript_15912:158-868(+)